MACDAKDALEILIKVDRRFIRTCWSVYGAILLISIGLTLAIHFQLSNIAPSLSGLLVNGFIVPLVLKHVQRSGAINILEILSEQCRTYERDDPRCHRIADNVDNLLRARGNV